MKRSLLVLFLLITGLSGFAQRRHTLFVEGLGNGLTISANYEIRLKPGRNDGWGLRAGIGGANLDGTDNQGFPASVGIVTLPLGVNYLVGAKRNAFEGGAGVTTIIVSAKGTINDSAYSGTGVGAAGFLNAGYRFQPLNKGFMFRLNWTPMISSEGFQADWAGLGLGYSFK